MPSLAGKRIGAIPKTTNEAVIATQQPTAKLIPVRDRSEALEKLQSGEIDGFAGDGIILVGMKRNAPNPEAYEVVPEFPYQYESYACILPHDQSAWSDLVNYSLIKFMEGIVSDRAEAVAIYERWFGEDGVTPYSREAINDYFQGIVAGYEWIPLVDY
jgi:polar amino acid transport system substrate-binding protein